VRFFAFRSSRSRCPNVTCWPIKWRL